MKCVIENCGFKATRRGLCERCLRDATKCVDSGAVTWLDLEEADLCGQLYAGQFKNSFRKKLPQKAQAYDDIRNGVTSKPPELNDTELPYEFPPEGFSPA